MKKQTKEDILQVLIALGMLVFCVFALVLIIYFGAMFFGPPLPPENSSTSTDSDRLYFNETSNELGALDHSQLGDRFFAMPIAPPNYSEKGYVQVKPSEGAKLYIFQCINSTLIMEDNKIGCQNG